MELARLFVGLPLPESYQRGLGELVRSLKPVAPGSCSWTKPGNWHIKPSPFWGMPTLARIPDIGAALAGTGWRAFDFKAAGGGFFPSAERPRVLWVGAGQGEDQCREMAAAVTSRFGRAGF